MESLQLAQMLADLADLNAAQEARAALAVVTANKTLPDAPPAAGPSPSPDHPSDAVTAPPVNKLLEQPQREHHPRAASTGVISRTSSPATLDKFGRRLISPPLSRTNSATGTPGTSTPLRRESEVDLDVAQATSLMQLYEIRAKIKQQDNSSLLKAREKISALRQLQAQSPVAAHAHSERHHHAPSSSDAHQTRFTYPKTSA